VGALTGDKYVMAGCSVAGKRRSRGRLSPVTPRLRACDCASSRSTPAARTQLGDEFWPCAFQYCVGTMARRRLSARL
jgi:hypothetical protein